MGAAVSVVLVPAQVANGLLAVLHDLEVLANSGLHTGPLDQKGVVGIVLCQQDCIITFHEIIVLPKNWTGSLEGD
jgi:hypothetical protein